MTTHRTGTTHLASRTSSLASSILNRSELPSAPSLAAGTDAATPAIDYTNEDPGFPTINIDGIKSYAAAPGIVGISIADQLVAAGKTWKSYQESLPLAAPTTSITATATLPTLPTSPCSTLCGPRTPPTFSSGEIVQLYAVKHNPFAYFQSTQQGTDSSKQSGQRGSV
jgi:hypothetical protein